MSLRHHLPDDPRTLPALLALRAHATPDAIYATATETGRTLTFRDLARAAVTVPALLARHGIVRGDVVSIVMPNGLQTLRTLVGAMAGGLCVNPVNLLSQPDQMRYVLEHSDARGVIVAPEWIARVRELVAGIGRPIVVLEADPDATRLPDEPTIDDAQTVRNEALARPADEVTPDALALLMYTSGTTGKPKGVMLTQANLVANAHAISREHGLGAGDRVFAVLPLYHINAFGVTMLAPIAHGGSLAMPPKFSAARFWQTAAAHGCTWINVVPTIISYLLEGEAPERAQTAAIRFCRSASAALPPEHHRAFEQKFGIDIIETMGLTETVAPSFSNPLDKSARKVGSVGRPSGCEARIVDEHGREVPDGTTGEIVIRGPQVTPGYYKNPEATAGAFFPEGWFRTGDLGMRDADGYFFVTGRIKELIIKGGENIAPREIDEALLKHPAVLDAAAVGIPDRHYGQEIMVCVMLRPGHACGEDALRAFCAEHLGRYKTPKVIRFVDELPRGPSGKVQRLKLLDLLAAAA